jgi:3',5'-cyclic-AMP phosphodiesterase
VSSHERAKTLHVVQFSDMHLFGDPDGRLLGVQTYESFLEVIRLAASRNGTPDFYLLTGDLSMDETEGSYRRLAGMLADLQAPTYYLPGNHDDLAIMQAVLGAHGEPFRPARSFVSGNWLFVLLDTHLCGEAGGHVSAEELSYLDEMLANHPDKYALVGVHHQAVPMNVRWLDEIGIDNAGEFLSMLARHANVRVVLGGHVHQELDCEHQGMRFLFTPSTCVQFKPRARDFAVDVLPPGYRWLTLGPDGSVATAVERTSTLPPGLDVDSPGY